MVSIGTFQGSHDKTMRIVIPAPRRRLKLLEDWEFMIIKDKQNAMLLKDYVNIKQNSFRLVDLEAWRAINNTKIMFLAGTYIHVERYIISRSLSLPDRVVLKLRDTTTNKWTTAQRVFWVMLADFNCIDCEYVD